MQPLVSPYSATTPSLYLYLKYHLDTLDLDLFPVS